MAKRKRKDIIKDLHDRIANLHRHQTAQASWYQGHIAGRVAAYCALIDILEGED